MRKKNNKTVKLTMTPAIRSALAEYAKAVLRYGWRGAEPVVEKYQKSIPNFSRWALALCLAIKLDAAFEAGSSKMSRSKKS